MNTLWRWFRERYLTVDARTLGLFRIAFGVHLMVNLYDRTRGPDGLAFYTNLGVLPNHFALFAPMGEHIWSLLFPFSTPGEVQVAFALILGVYFAYTIGYRTKLAQLLVVMCQVSLANRNLILQNGGIVVTTVVAVWTTMLPLGARFSVDHLRSSLACRVERSAAALSDRAALCTSPRHFVRLAYFGIALNFAFIYYFNCVHKRGSTWHDGSAVHWVLWQNRINTVWAAWLRMHEPRWLSPLATYGTLAIEGALPALILSPIFQKWTRRAAILGIFMLHGGISLMMTLGPFSYTMMCFSLLLVSEHDWAWLARVGRHAARGCDVRFDERSPGYLRLGRVLARIDLLHALRLAALHHAPRSPARPDEAALEAAETAAAPGLVARASPTGAAASALSDNDAASLGGWVSGAPALACIARALVFARPLAWLLQTRALAAGAARVLARLGSDRRPLSEPSPWCEAPGNAWRARAGAGFAELAAALMLATMLVQIGADNWAIPERYRVKQRPALVRDLVDVLRIPQGWSMFSPDAPREDGTIVIDAVLSDGRHLDPRKQAPPDFEAALHGPWFDDQQWCDWDLRLSFDGNRHLYPSFRDYIARLDHQDSWEQTASIRSFDVYWVSNSSPPPGSTVPFNLRRKLLFSGTGLDATAGGAEH